MDKILKIIKSFLTRNNLRFLSVLVITYLIAGDISYANQTGVTQEQSDKLVNALNGFIAVAATLLGLVTAFITLFTYPGWTNGTLFGLTEYLRDIWVLVSNVVYFIFAFILVTIAFMNIIGKGEGNWELKQALPRFIVGVLIVPFTWFLVQFILSISAVLTVAVLSLPYDVFRDKLQDDTSDSALLNQAICRDIIINLQSGEGEPQGVSLSGGGSDEGFTQAIRCRDEGAMVSIMDIVTGEEGGQGVQNSMFGIISVYTYGILRVQELSTVNAGDLRFYQEIIDLILKIFFDIFFIAVYLILMIALLFALFTRGIKLWIFIMFSPIFGLLYFFGKSKEGFGESGKNYNVKEFISLAMIPVYVSAALAFGFVFILVATEGLKEHVSDGSTIDRLDLGGLQFEVIGSYGDGDFNLGVIGKLIVQIFGVAILWIAVMAALRSSEATKAIVEPIYQFGQSMGKLAAAAPTYAPIIPTGNGGMSITGLSAAGQRIEQGFRSQAQTQGTNFGERFTPAGGTNNPASQIQRMFAQSGLNASSNGQERLRLVDDALRQHGAILNTDVNARRALEEQLRNIGVEVEIANITDMSRISQQIHDGLRNANGITVTDRYASPQDILRILEQTPQQGTQIPPTNTQQHNVTINQGANNINIRLQGAEAGGVTIPQNIADNPNSQEVNTIRAQLQAMSIINRDGLLGILPSDGSVQNRERIADTIFPPSS